jgi:hypothetical protein
MSVAPTGRQSTTVEEPHMTRTVGAAIGAVIVFLFFVFGVAHPRLAATSPDVTASIRP